MADHTLKRLDELDWTFADVDTSYLTHGLHRYSSKFIPQIAKRCLENFSEPGQVVLDCFVGSGTTLLEAALIGRVGIGADITPVATLIAATKTTPVPPRLLQSAIHEHLELARSWIHSSRGVPILGEHQLPNSLEELSDPIFLKWFQEGVLRELALIRTAIDRITDVRIQRIAKAAFSNILRRCSNAHSGYPNVMFDRSAPVKTKAWEAYERQVGTNVHRLLDLWEVWPSEAAPPLVLQADARSLPLPDSSVDTIVTHPPYIAAVPYAEYLFLSLLWLGADVKEVDRRLVGGRRSRKDVVTRFLADMTTTFGEMERVLRAGGYCCIVIGNPVVRGRRIQLDIEFENLGKDAGLEIRYKISRPKMNMRANKMATEFVLVFQKPI